MNSPEIWKWIHLEREDLANSLAQLNADQWASASWCEGWSVLELVGHIVSAAEQTTLNFYRELAVARFNFNRFAETGARVNAQAGAHELVRRLRERTTTTNHPPAPVMAMLGEIVVHGDDIRRPLGLNHDVPQPALVAVADNWKNSNLLIGAKRRISGLTLRATDASWSHGSGPEISGPLQSLVLAMTGRRPAYGDLSGDGVAILSSRP
jgi:uncharacterized protein (TIGR03083 family)